MLISIAAGCDRNPPALPEPERPPARATPSASPPAPSLPANSAAPSQAQAGPTFVEPPVVPPVVAPTGAAPVETRAASPAPPAVSGSSSVELSAGVALPQTGPTGILMAFSVDYVFSPGTPDPSLQYGWVIQRSRGEAIGQPVVLKEKGTLQLLVPGWRPEEGPFQCFLVEARKDGTRRQISRTVSLREP